MTAALGTSTSYGRHHVERFPASPSTKKKTSIYDAWNISPNVLDPFLLSVDKMRENENRQRGIMGHWQQQVSFLSKQVEQNSRSPQLEAAKARCENVLAGLQTKLTLCEQELAQAEEILEQALKTQEEVAAEFAGFKEKYDHRGQKSGSVKVKLNNQWPKMQAQRSRANDGVQQAQQKVNSIKEATRKLTGEFALKKEELNRLLKEPSGDASQAPHFHEELGKAKKALQKSEAELRVAADILNSAIDEFIHSNFSDRKEGFRSKVRQALKESPLQSIFDQ